MISSFYFQQKQKLNTSWSFLVIPTPLHHLHIIIRHFGDIGDRKPSYVKINYDCEIYHQMVDDLQIFPH
jgi:hypothetical protein